MKYSELTLTDKLNEARNLVLDFSKNVIHDINKKINERKPKQTEATYYDLIAESFFSIQSFCMLVNEGLISSACAILRVILEQTSITYLLANNNIAKERFLEIKKDMASYLVADNNCRKIEKDKICQKYGLSSKINIYNFFDYGWCTLLGCKSICLKDICDKAGTSQIYEMTTEFLHGFAHGQRSIYQFYRRKNGVDHIFINDIHLNLFQLFYLLLGTVTKEFGEDIINTDNADRFNMIECLDVDIRTRVSEDYFRYSIDIGDLTRFDVNDMYEIFAATVRLLDMHYEQREKYLLSQAYMRLAKLIIATKIIKSNSKLLVEKNDVLSMSKLLGKYKPNLSNYDPLISLDKLLIIMDKVDDDWSFGDDDVDYNVAYCINSLIEAIIH